MRRSDVLVIVKVSGKWSVEDVSALTTGGVLTETLESAPERLVVIGEVSKDTIQRILGYAGFIFERVPHETRWGWN